MSETSEIKKNKRKLEGVVISDKMSKTRTILIERLKQHSKYRKYFKVSRSFKAHDENDEYKVGDRVIIEESRPISREKRWVIKEKIENKPKS